jgi:hypothetical protein
MYDAFTLDIDLFSRNTASQMMTWWRGYLIRFALVIWIWLFLGAFAKLRKATVSFVMSVCPSVCPRGTTRLPLDGFSWNLTFDYFSIICRENSSFIKIWQEYRVVYMMICIHFLSSVPFLPRMKNILDKSCRGVRLIQSYLGPKLRMSGAKPPHPHLPPWPA